jgi:hypothetical protein
MYTSFITWAWRPRRESNSRIEILQISELPLFYVALVLILYAPRYFVYVLPILLAFVDCEIEKGQCAHAGFSCKIFSEFGSFSFEKSESAFFFFFRKDGEENGGSASAI